MAGWATYGYCASHSRYFWGLRLHLVATPSGLPVAFALTSATTDERDTALDMIAMDPNLARPGQILITDKGYRSATFEAALTNAGITLIRPTYRTEKPDRYNDSYTPSAKSWNQSIRPSKPNSTSNATSHEDPTVSQPVSRKDSSPSPPPSGTTKPPTNPAPPAPSSPTTTDPLELIV